MYASFVTPPEVIERQKREQQDRLRPVQERVKQLVKEHNLSEIQNIFLNMSSYYYSKATDTIYEVCNLSERAELLRPSAKEDRQLREANNLPIKKQ